MRLDNRSRIVHLTGDFISSEKATSSTKEWFESTGGAITSSDGGLLVTYPTRDMAEKALAMGTGNIELAGKGIQAGWYADGGSLGGNGGQVGEVEMADESRRGEDMDDD